MMEQLRGWLLSVIAVSLLCALADTLMPPGAVKKAGKLICGLVLAAAVLAPAVELDVEEGGRWLEEYFSGTQDREEELKRQVEEARKRIIEQEYAAYIVDKAAQMGVACTAQVECRAEGEGLYLPVRAQITGPLAAGQREELSLALERDLGLPREGQSYHSGEGAP